MGALLRWREPAVLVLIALVAIRQLLAAGLALAGLAGAVGSYGLAGYAASGRAGEPLALVLLAVLLGTCHVTPVTSRARLLTVVGLVTVVVAVLVQLVAAAFGLAQASQGQLSPPLGPLSVGESLLDLVVPLLALLALAVLLRRPTSPEVVEQPALPANAEAAPDEAAADPALQPTWQPDVAAGAAWLSAGDAASGRPPTAAAPVGDQDEPHPWAAGPR